MKNMPSAIIQFVCFHDREHTQKTHTTIPETSGQVFMPIQQLLLVLAIPSIALRNLLLPPKASRPQFHPIQQTADLLLSRAQTVMAEAYKQLLTSNGKHSTSPHKGQTPPGCPGCTCCLLSVR
jgi:hypothetical protein